MPKSVPITTPHVKRRLLPGHSKSLIVKPQDKLFGYASISQRLPTLPDRSKHLPTDDPVTIPIPIPIPIPTSPSLISTVIHQWVICIAVKLVVPNRPESMVPFSSRKTIEMFLYPMIQSKMNNNQRIIAGCVEDVLPNPQLNRPFQYKARFYLTERISEIDIPPIASFPFLMNNRFVSLETTVLPQVRKVPTTKMTNQDVLNQCLINPRFFS